MEKIAEIGTTAKSWINYAQAIDRNFEAVDVDQKNLVVEIDFPTASDLSVWFANPVNVGKVRQGSIFRITNEEEPDFLAVFNNTARAFELKPIDKIVTKAILESHNGNPGAHKPLYDKIIAEANTNISRQFKDTSAQGSAVSYLRYTGSQYVLSDTRPTVNENAPFALSGTTVNTKVFAGSLSKAGFFSPKASYTESIYLTGLQEQVRYTVKVVYAIKGTVIYDETRTIVGMPNESTKELIFVVPSDSTYNQRVYFSVGDAYTRTVSITKNTSSNNHTVNIASVPASGLYSFTQRYGGVIYATDIFDETQQKSQDTINAEIITKLNTLLSGLK